MNEPTTLPLAPVLAPSSAGRLGAWATAVRWPLATLLLVHVLLWTWAGVASRTNLDMPGDMVEAYAWSQGWQWGYYKHPPLSAWITGLWFHVVPESHLGFALLAAVNGALGLAGLAVLAREFLPSRWVLLTVAVASLTPGITTLAMRFNANAILISSWPWAMALFVRMMHRQRRSDAVLCGLACAAAMLGKYYSAVLLFSLLAAALWLPHWRARLLRGPFLLAVATFTAAILPHALWLLAQTEGPLQYAQAATHTGSQATSIVRALHFALAHWAFPALALGLFVSAMIGPARWRAAGAALLAPLRPRGDEVWILAVMPIVATMAGTVLTGSRTAWVWGLPISASLSLLLAVRARDAGADVDAPRLWRTLAAIWALVAFTAPAWWWVGARHHSETVTEPREEMAAAVETLWHNRHGAALPFVGGTRALAASVAFYGRSHPRYWSLWNSAVETPWVRSDDVAAAGGIIVCATGDTECVSLAETWSADAVDLHVAKSARGQHFDAVGYRVFLIDPSVAPAF